LAVTVDIHCHTFNADDLPVRGFAYRLVLHGVPMGNALAELVDKLIQAPADNYATDVSRVDALLAPGRGLEAAVAQAPPDPAQFEREVDLAMAELTRRDPDLLPRVGTQVLEAEQPLEAAAGMEGIRDWLPAARRAVRWVKLFGRSRLDLAADLVRTFKDEVDLYTPLLVDLGTGVGDVAKTTVAQQVELYEKISRASMSGVVPGIGKATLLPFVGFDPLRELRARPTQPIRSPLEIVQDAVLRYGFVGVKLYPQMGWRPSGNAPWGALTAEDAGALDEIVEEFFAWCEAENVPLTAHCSNSNYAHQDFGTPGAEYGRPEDWLPVLERHPGLHVNLGHFGGVRKDEAPTGWPWRIARATRSAPGLYADVGNHRIDDHALLEGYFDMLEAMRSTLETATIADRLMYGSDWFMEALHPEHDDFLTTYRSNFERRFGADATEDFLGRNALRFLGFDDAGNRNAKRLTARYESFAPDRMPSWLAR
jgi:predicted TIM-barrel fold metal-dependent hydrolase